MPILKGLVQLASRSSSATEEFLRTFSQHATTIAAELRTDHSQATTAPRAGILGLPFIPSNERGNKRLCAAHEHAGRRKRARVTAQTESIQVCQLIRNVLCLQDATQVSEDTNESYHVFIGIFWELQFRSCSASESSHINEFGCSACCS